MKLARISHRLSATTSHIFMSTALHLNSLLNILTNMPASSVLRAPCIHEYLQGFATKPCEKSGLAIVFSLLILGAASYGIAEEWHIADRMVAVIGNEAVCESELYAYVEFFRPDFPVPLASRDVQYLTDALNELINRKLAVAFFKKLFTPIFLPEYIDLKEKNIHSRIPDETVFQESLRKAGFTSLTLKEWINDEYILLWGINRRFGAVEITSDELAAFLKSSEETNDSMWQHWLSGLSQKSREDFVRDILTSRKMRERLGELYSDLHRQASIELLLIR